jgi:hypothetical protein
MIRAATIAAMLTRAANPELRGSVIAAVARLRRSSTAGIDADMPTILAGGGRTNRHGPSASRPTPGVRGHRPAPSPPRPRRSPVGDGPTMAACAERLSTENPTDWLPSLAGRPGRIERYGVWVPRPATSFFRCRLDPLAYGVWRNEPAISSVACRRHVSRARLKAALDDDELPLRQELAGVRQAVPRDAGWYSVRSALPARYSFVAIVKVCKVADCTNESRT